MMRHLINLCGNCCELFIMIYFLKSTYKLRFKKCVSIPLFALCVLFQFLNNCLFLGKSMLVTFAALLFTLFVVLLFKTRPFNTIILTFTLHLIAALPEMVVGMIMATVFGLDIGLIQSNLITFAIGTFTSKFLSYVVVIFIKARHFHISDEAIKRNIHWILMLPVASVLITLLFLNTCLQLDDKALQALILFSTLMICAANIAVFYIITKQNDLIETKEKLLFAETHIHRQIIHYEELYKYQTELRMFRHDTKNSLLAMMGILKEGDTEKAMQALQNSLDFINEMNKSIVDSGNPIIDAVLHAKLHDAATKGINIKISTKLTDKINADELELGIILGNALDNAIEAVEKNTAAKAKEITFSMISSSERISISVENPVSESVNTAKLITTKENKALHGFGVQSIKTIAQKYDGLADFICENGFFTANINLANKPSEK